MLVDFCFHPLLRGLGKNWVAARVYLVPRNFVRILYIFLFFPHPFNVVSLPCDYFFVHLNDRIANDFSIYIAAEIYR